MGNLKTAGSDHLILRPPVSTSAEAARPNSAMLPTATRPWAVCVDRIGGLSGENSPGQQALRRRPVHSDELRQPPCGTSDRLPFTTVRLLSQTQSCHPARPLEYVRNYNHRRQWQEGEHTTGVTEGRRDQEARVSGDGGQALKGVPAGRGGQRVGGRHAEVETEGKGRGKCSAGQVWRLDLQRRVRSMGRRTAERPRHACQF